jgi:hypothetical protein
MQMRLAILGVVIACLVVGGIEAYWHWYAGTQDTPKAHSLREWYIYRDPISDKPYHAGFVDLIFPAIALGFAAGALTARQSLRVLVWCLFLLPLGVVALFPLYAAFIPTKESDVWWRFATSGVRVVAFIPGYFKAALLCLFFGAVGRNGMRQIHGRTLDAV